MKEHSPYTEPEWQKDESHRLTGGSFRCPDCNSEENFWPKHHLRSDGSERHYRACKICGFWQEVDGSAPYRIWLAAHTCAVRLRPGQLTVTCVTCENRLIAEPGSSEIQHRCGKHLSPWEEGFSCGNCGEYIGREHAQALPSAGSDSRPTA